MLRLSERLFQFYRPIKLAQVSFREFSISNFTVWRLGIFSRNSWWFCCDSSNTNFSSSISWLQNYCSAWAMRERTTEKISVNHYLLADVWQDALAKHSCKRAKISPVLKVFLFFLTRPLGQLKKNFTKIIVSKNCT